MWICDVCKQPVEIKRGWVEWRRPLGKNEGYGLRLVHHSGLTQSEGGCQYDDNQTEGLSDVPLEEILRHYGLKGCIEMVCDNTWPLTEGARMIERLFWSY